MGGHTSGEIASRRAVEVVQGFIAERAQVLRDFAADPSPDRGTAAARLVEDAVRAACADIFRRGAADVRLHGMGTTFVCLVIAGERGVVANVGDSRAYLSRRGDIHVLTEDHTLIAEQVKMGELTPEEARRSTMKGVLTRALGALESVQVDTLIVDLHAGDRFLLCSDGLYGYLSSAEIAERFGAVPLEALPAAFVAVANERGGRDNITAIAVALEESGVQAPASLARIDALKGIPLFEHLSYREQSEVLAVARTRKYPAGSRIVQEDEPGGDLFVVLDGEVSVEQHRLPIATLQAGGHFGEMGLVDAGPRSASVYAKGDVRAMVIPRDAMLGLMQREPTLAVKLLWAFVQVLSHRLRVANEGLSDALAGPETARLPG